MSVRQNKKNMQRTRRRRLFVIVTIIFLLLAIMAGAGAALLPRSDRIAEGVAVADVDLSRKTVTQSSEDLNNSLTAIVDAPVTLKAGSYSTVISLRELGITPDVTATLERAYEVGREGSLPIRMWSTAQLRWQKVSINPLYRFDEAASNVELTSLAKKVDRVPKNAGVKWTGSQVVVIADEPGMLLNVPAALQMIRVELLGRISNGDAALAELNLPYNQQPAHITAEALREVDTELGKFSSSFASSSQNRARNIEIATQAMNQHILMPDEQFSFNKVVGERTAKRGYKIAPVIVNGQMDSGLGGGVCQVSTALYNAVLLANLKIVERRHHSRPSSYVPSGLDATVAFGSIDFKFANNMETPVVMITSNENRNLVVRLLGKGPAPDVKILRSGISSLGGKTVTRKDPSLPAGTRKVSKGSGGLAVTVSREVAGKVTVISRDRYTGTPTIIRVGSGPAKVSPPIDTTPPATETDQPAQPGNGAPDADNALPNTRSSPPAIRNQGR